MKKLLVSQRDLNKHVRKICTEIESSNWRPDYVVGLTRGGLIPAVMISEYFDLRCETLKISLRDGGECESNLWMAEDAFGYVPTDERQDAEFEITHLPVKGDASDRQRRKNILIVDDINDTGATINWLLNDWPSGCLPEDRAWKSIWNHNVRFAVLYDNAASNSVVKMDYVGKEIDKSKNNVWVDFPWESWWKPWWRR